MKILQLSVTKEDGDVRLDRWIKRNHPDMTQGMIQKMCRTGQIRVDGGRVKASDHLVEGNVVRIPVIEAGDRKAKPVSKIDEKKLKQLREWIIYEDEALFVLNKPSGIAVQGGSTITHHIDGLLEGLKGKSNYRPSLVHRLDKDTSGLLLIARYPDAAAKLASAFRGRNVKKTYWAVTTRRPNPLTGKIDQPLLKIERPGESYVVIAPDNKEAQRAVTEYEVKDYAARKLAWVELHPLTGRMHQLRVHCASIRSPILGDKKYNQELPSLEGFSDQLHLHARSLDIPHPLGGRLQIEAELPNHMKATFQRLGFDLPSGNHAVRIKK